MTIELPARPDQTAFNLRRWDELLDDPELARIEGRIETDRHGRIQWSRLEAVAHARLQTEIGILLGDRLSAGEALFVCPISTADGVKATDVAWASAKTLRDLGNRECFVKAPEICVEVLSLRNTKAEIIEKRRLYFDAGAKEVWVCSRTGEMTFFGPKSETPISKSKLCPKVPNKVTLGT